MADEAQAVVEVAKTTAEIVKAAGGMGSYLARIFGSIPDNLLGLMVGDWLEHKRRRHLGVLEANTARLLDGIAPERLTEPSPSVLIPLLLAAVDESRTELQDLWAALLANAMVDGGKRVRRDYFEAVRRMEPLDAVVLEAIVRLPTGSLDPFDKLCAAVGLSRNEVMISLAKLRSLDCFSGDLDSAPTPFAIGLAAAMRVD